MSEELKNATSVQNNLELSQGSAIDENPTNLTEHTEENMWVSEDSNIHTDKRLQDPSERDHEAPNPDEERRYMQLVNAHGTYLHTHFAHRHYNFGWAETDNGFASKVYRDGTLPAVVVVSLMSGENERHGVCDDKAWLRVKGDHVTSAREGDGERFFSRDEAGEIPDPDDRPYERPEDTVFFHELGLAARCRKRGTTIVCDLCKFSVVTHPSGVASPILANGIDDAEAPDEACVLLRVSYDESGSYEIMLADHLEFVSDDLRDVYMNTLLPRLSEVVESLRHEGRDC